MFGKKEKIIQSLPEVKVTRIPEDFYAGTNPVVKFSSPQNEKKPIVLIDSTLPKADKKIVDQQTMVGAGNRLHPANLFTNWKFLVLFSVIFLVIGGAIMGGYYYWQYSKTNTLVIPKPEITLPVAETNTTTEILSTEVSTTEEVTTAPVVVLSALIEFPSTLLGDSIDTDGDVITDVGETLFNTDPVISDFDGDKYPDGHEVFYLYNPAGVEPMKLIDSGLISVYSNPAFFYRLYYPKDWAVGIVDADSRDVLFSTITGENIEVRVINKNIGETFNDWFARNAVGERLENYLPFESVFKETGFARKDNMVFFIVKDNYVYAIVYHTTDSNTVNYRQVGVMIARSFQLGNNMVIPDRILEQNQNDVGVVSGTSF